MTAGEFLTLGEGTLLGDGAMVSAGSWVCLTLGSVAFLWIALTVCSSRFTDPDCLVLSGPVFWLV